MSRIREKIAIFIITVLAVVVCGMLSFGCIWFIIFLTSLIHLELNAHIVIGYVVIGITTAMLIMGYRYLFAKNYKQKIYLNIYIIIILSIFTVIWFFYKINYEVEKDYNRWGTMREHFFYISLFILISYIFLAIIIKGIKLLKIKKEQ